MMHELTDIFTRVGPPSAAASWTLFGLSLTQLTQWAQLIAALLACAVSLITIAAWGVKLTKKRRKK